MPGYGYRVPDCARGFPSFHFRDLEHIRRKVLLYGDATGIDYHAAHLKVFPFLEDPDLVADDIVDAFFFVIIKGPHSPTEAELCHQGFFLGEDVQRGFWTIAAQHESRVSALSHSYEGIRIRGFCQFACIIANRITEECW